MRLGALSLTLVVGCVAPPPPPPPPPPAQAPAPGVIDVDVEGADLTNVMDDIGRRVGATIVVDPDVHETVTVSLRGIAWREAVDGIARMCRCEVSPRGEALVLHQCCIVTLQLTRADLPTVLSYLGALQNVRVVVPPGLEGTWADVDLRCQAYDALSTFLARLGRFDLIAEDGGRQLRVVPLERTLVGRVLGHDHDLLALRLDDGSTVQVQLDPDLTPAAREVLDLTNEGDRVAARCDARRWDRPRLIALVSQ